MSKAEARARAIAEAAADLRMLLCGEKSEPSDFVDDDTDTLSAKYPTAVREACAKPSAAKALSVEFAAKLNAQLALEDASQTPNPTDEQVPESVMSAGVVRSSVVTSAVQATTVLNAELLDAVNAGMGDGGEKFRLEDGRVISPATRGSYGRLIEH